MAKKKTTVTRKDQYGNEIEVPVGVDGKNPVSPNNPSPKAVPADQWVEVETDDIAQEAAEAESVKNSDSENQKKTEPKKSENKKCVRRAP